MAESHQRYPHLTAFCLRCGSARGELSLQQRENIDAEMVPLYLARIEDLGPGDLIKIDCACSHTGLLTAESPLRLGRGNREKVLDLKDRVRCRRCSVRGRAVVSIKWAKEMR